MKKYINIGNKKVGAGQPVFIIAEAGVNHNGSQKLAKKMIEAAKLAGADAIKFQTFKTERLVTKKASIANYQKKTIGAKSQYHMLKRYELTYPEFEALFDYCRKNDILFLSTPFDFLSAEFLYNLGVPTFKIGSGDLTNIPLVLQIAGYGKPVILSTGMSNVTEVKEAVDAIYSTGNRKLLLLHCTSNYPAEHKDVNLKAIQTLKKEFDIHVGYSDHTQGIEVAVAASAMGACIIEKHFTLDKALWGPDHNCSLEPDELKRMVQSIRNIEVAMGDGIKVPRESEGEIKKVARKSIVARCNIPKGSMMTGDMLTVKRPGTGINPSQWNNVIGKTAKRDFCRDELIEL